jgi:hypothetical protein
MLQFFYNHICQRARKLTMTRARTLALALTLTQTQAQTPSSDLRPGSQGGHSWSSVLLVKRNYR